MQRHEVPLQGAESWGGGGWGQTARHEASGGVVPSRVWRRQGAWKGSCGRGQAPPLRRCEHRRRRGRACPVPRLVSGAARRGSCGRGQAPPLRRCEHRRRRGRACPVPRLVLPGQHGERHAGGDKPRLYGAAKQPRAWGTAPFGSGAAGVSRLASRHCRRSRWRPTRRTAAPADPIGAASFARRRGRSGIPPPVR